MIVCENAPEFNRPDPNDGSIALGEIDVYANDFTAPADQNHRLTIRRRWPSRDWELIRVYHRPQGRPAETVCVGDLADVIREANAEWRRAWGDQDPREADSVCDHQDHRASRCGVRDRP
jgi:hypothetical protein